MAGRFVGMALATIGFLLPTCVHAQGMGPYGQFGPPNPWLVTNGYQPNPPDGGGPALAPVYAPDPPNYGPVSGGIYREPSGILTKVMPQEEDFPPTPMERFLESVTRSSTFRLEYMFVEIQQPDNSLLGAEVTDLDDPRIPFNVGGTVFARAEDLEGVGLRDLDGVRATFVTPLTFADVEFSGFVIEQGADKVRPPELPSTTDLIATTVMVDGQPTTSGNAILWDDFYEARYFSDVWGTDARLVFNTGRSGEGFRLRPTIGARFNNVREVLTQTGSSGGVPGVIDTDTNNHLYGAVLGLRGELNHRWFRAGIEPRISLGMNKYRAKITTENFASTTEGKIVTELEDTKFAPVAEAVAYSAINVTEHFSVYLSYQLIYATKVARPDEMTIYNVTSGGTSNFLIDNHLEEFTIEGFTVGGEWHF